MNIAVTVQGLTIIQQEVHNPYLTNYNSEIAGL